MLSNLYSNNHALRALFLIFILLSAGRTSMAGQIPKDPGLYAFEQRHEEVQNKVRSADLSSEAGERAKELRFELNKALIELDARVTTLKLEAAEFDGERQQAALDDLLELGAERQRVIARARHQLETLAGSAGHVPPVTPVVSELPGDDRLAGGKQTSVKYDADEIKELRRLIGIELEPEDVTTGEFE